MKEKGKKQIFILFRCDEWEGTDSMRFCGATTSPTRLKSMIVSEIKEGNMIYGSEEDSVSTQIKNFKADFKKETRTIINGRLKYGYYDYVYDGEIE